MSKKEHIERLCKGKKEWNLWRKDHPRIKPHLSDYDFSSHELAGYNLEGADLRVTNLSGQNLHGTNLCGAELYWANLSKAKLKETNLENAILYEAELAGIDFRKTNLNGANFDNANLTGAIFSGIDMFDVSFKNANLENAIFANSTLEEVDFTRANLTSTDMRGARLDGAILDQATLIRTDLVGADLFNSSVYGVSAWDVKLKKAQQRNLSISPKGAAAITVDNLEIAQFIYLLLKHEKIRDVIQTMGQRAVLIIGRFSKERKEILDAIADKLRDKKFLPIIFDFVKPTHRDFTETIMTLAGLCLFVIADITNPKSSPLELQAAVPNYMIPFVPIIQEGEKPFAMFQDLHTKYSSWVLSPLVYDTKENLLKALEAGIIGRAVERHDDLVIKKTEEMKTVHVKEFFQN